MSLLFKPLKIKSVEFKNRIITSPMCMYSSLDGFSTNWHLVHYGTRAMGGAAAVILEAAAVTPEGRISIGDLGIWKDEHIAGLKEIADFIKSSDCIPGVQLAHAGRKGSTLVERAESKFLKPGDEGGWELVAPSAIPFSKESPVPKEMTISDIEALIEAFARAAERAVKAGFELLEIHAAHGYLLSEFLSPVSNTRTDQYGGTLENRGRLLLEVVKAVSQIWPHDKPLAVRISATDWDLGDWDIQSSIWLSNKLAELGVDIIDVSSAGWIEKAEIPVGPSYQVPLAAAIKKETPKNLFIGTVGLLTDALQAESILVSGDADFIFLGRELLRNPYFPLYAAKELHEDIVWPEAYELAKLK